MRILKKSLLSLSAILAYSNNVYATTAESIVQEGTIDFGKVILLLVTAALIGLVLLLGYKMDKNDEQAKRKEEIVRKNKKDLNNSHNDIEDNFVEKYDKVTEETAAFGNIYPNLSEEMSEDDNGYEDFDKTAVLERVDLSTIKENYIENEILDNDESENEIEEYEVEEYEEILEEDDYENSYDSTMVFDTSSIQNEDDDEALSTIKGYDFDEEDLEELEANNETEVEVKRYTRKKTTKVVEQVVEEKPKRGRKPAVKKEDEEKPKRGRKTSPKKDEEIENKKIAVKADDVVGTKDLEEKNVTGNIVEEKPKRTRKTTTKKSTETKVKKTRAASTRRAAEKEAQKEKAAIQKKALEDKKKKATKKSAAKKGTTKKATETKVKKTRAASVRKEIEKMQKK